MLDRLIPTPRSLEVDHIELAAPAARVFERLRHGDLATSPVIRALFAVRTLPDRLRGKPVDTSLRIDHLTSSVERPGFQLLLEEPPHELAVGAIGKVWHSEIPFVHVADAREYLDFAQPDFVKVAWALRVVPRGDDACRVEVEVRVDATDEEAWRKFRNYFRLIGPGSHFIRRSALAALAREFGAPEPKEDATDGLEGRPPRDDLGDVVDGVGGVAVLIAAFLSPFHRRARSHWGIDEATATRVYPGDELLPEPRWSYTHGVTIEAPAERVWPWVAQIGADRAGFYSYQWLENLFGCEVQNAEVVRPEWEAQVGQALVLHPDPKSPRFEIVAVERGRHVLAYAGADERAKALGEPWASSSWLFLVEPMGEGRCRFISRHRAACSEDLATRLAFGPTLLEPVGFAMDRRMLLGVKERAERA